MKRKICNLKKKWKMYNWGKEEGLSAKQLKYVNHKCILKTKGVLNATIDKIIHIGI